MEKDRELFRYYFLRFCGSDRIIEVLDHGHWAEANNGILL